MVKNWISALVLLAAALLAPVQPAHAVSDLWDYSTTAGTNTDIGGVSVAENAPFANMNNALRELMAELKRGVYSQGSDIASASTTSICAASTSPYVKVTGTTTITSFGTAAAGCWRIVTFTGALTLTHNATSLIIPNGSNITTAAGDVIGAVSEGSGNWRVIFFSRVPFLATANTFTAAQAITSTAAGTLLTLQSTDAGAGRGPDVVADRFSASPAVDDVLGGYLMRGRSTTGASVNYSQFYGQIIDATNGSEDARVVMEAMIGGVSTPVIQAGPGVRIGAPTGGDKGSGTLNAAAGVYIAGHGTVAQQVSDTEATYVTCGTIMPDDDTIPQNTEGDEVLSVAITPVNASSTLEIIATLNVGAAGTGTEVIAAIFVDSTANALNAGGTFLQNAASMNTLVLRHEVSAGSTSARTYKVRVGSAAASDAFLNGHGTSRQFGGVAISSLVVREILPQ